MAITSANQLELLQTAEAVAREKMIDPALVVEAMEESSPGLPKSATARKWTFACAIRSQNRHGDLYPRAHRGRRRRVRKLPSRNDRRAGQAVSLKDPQSAIRCIEEVPPVEMGRIAAQSAKQVILQKSREAERDRQFEEFKDRAGTIINGVVKREEYGNVIVECGRGEAILRRNDKIGRESYRPNDRVRCYIKDVRREPRAADFPIPHRPAIHGRTVQDGSAGDLRRHH